MRAQGSAHPGRSQSNVTIDFSVFHVKHKSDMMEKQRLRGNPISEISASYVNHFSFFHLCYYYLLSYLILPIPSFLLLLILTFVIPTLTPGKKLK